MSTSHTVRVTPRGGESAKRPPHHAPGRRRLITALIFMAPALVLLGVLVAYPVVYSLWRSMFDASGVNFIGGQNYVTMFTDPATFISIRNNIIWVIVAPVTCTVLGLIFAVLMNRIKWATAFKLIVFMPMAISMVASGVIFRTLFQEDPNLGAVNAGLVAVHDAFSPGASYPGARPGSDSTLTVASDGEIQSQATVAVGSVQNFPLVGLQTSTLPGTAKPAVAAETPAANQITGTVWLDFVPGGGGTPGTIGDGKMGLPGVTVEVVDTHGAVVASAVAADDGTYTINSPTSSGSYIVTLPASNFSQGYSGISWLGPTLVTAVIILSYVWIWAGFSMVMIASGLSAMDISLQEAARVDGANEWQVFRRITAPLLMPVLIVVFITLIINVLKIFDLVYVIPPGSSLPDATVIAVQLWTVSFGGGNDQGLGSALAILLLVLVLPFMIINVRRFKMEREQ
ncbi:carbohydrate ABC transporter permease [Homoserinimonas sp. OAct 916]|uniref:carbohydrate ABC transporter permease n=1 Tax=Homoserinimonas sp. OAct 916 TaxID=2211450 RepID=UPI000DBE3EDB|nr:sugar ABC transporter permease [Homoserinimonas sp. OAct 916]